MRAIWHQVSKPELDKEGFQMEWDGGGRYESLSRVRRCYTREMCGVAYQSLSRVRMTLTWGGSLCRESEPEECPCLRTT